MKLISWNVNGIRACLGKGLAAWVEHEGPDVLCLQETKARPEQVELGGAFEPFEAFWNPAQKAGYSGVAIFAKAPVQSVEYGLGLAEHDAEGRVITLELEAFYLVNVYTPNAQNELRRLPYRMQWDEAFRAHLRRLRQAGKPVIFCGDLNVAHQEIDLARPRQNRFSAGFSDEERESFGRLLAEGFVDSFRHFHPEQEGAYSWWSYRGGARARNVGWRLDYFGVDRQLAPAMTRAGILADVTGSDHCPVLLEIR
jgi:exodeoxyribonuclease-3